MNTDCSNDKDRLPLNGIPFTDEEPDEEGVSVYEHHRLTADSGQKPMRIDKFLMEHLYNTSRNRLQRAAEQEFILVNLSLIHISEPTRLGMWWTNLRDWWCIPDAEIIPARWSMPSPGI